MTRNTVRICTLGIVLLVGTSAFAAEQIAAAPEVKPAAQAGQPGAVSGAKEEGKQLGANAPEMPTLPMKIPLFAREFAKIPIASVNGENIALEEASSAITELHMAKSEQKTAGHKNYAEVLDRLINLRLMVQEAKNIGLDQLPDVKEKLDTFGKIAYKEFLVRDQLKGIKADPKEVDKVYRARFMEWKIESVRFKKEADAKKMVQELKAGKNFESLLDQAAKNGQAEGGTEPSFQQAAKLHARLAQELSGMKVGAVSRIVPVDSGFVLVKLVDSRLVENAEAREQVEQQVLASDKQESLRKFRDALIKKYTKINEKLLKKLDFEAPKPGFAAMLKDTRTLVVIKGEKPLTVGDLAAAIKEKYFHGVELAISEKKVNSGKNDLLTQVLARRVVFKEGAERGIDKTDDYRARVRDYADSLIFGEFVERVVRPEVRINEAEVKAYYSQHAKDYTYPAKFKLNGVAFSKVEQAQASVTKLRQGVDLKWLKTTADGQLPEDAADRLHFDGSMIEEPQLPEDLRKVLAGARTGDAKVYADGAGHFYALVVEDYEAPGEMAFDQAKQGIAPTIYTEKLKKVMDEWAKKLRAASDIKIYVDFGEARGK